MALTDILNRDGLMKDSRCFRGYCWKGRDGEGLENDGALCDGKKCYESVGRGIRNHFICWRSCVHHREGQLTTPTSNKHEVACHQARMMSDIAVATRPIR